MYLCYYRHMSRDSVMSPIWGIFYLHSLKELSSTLLDHGESARKRFFHLVDLSNLDKEAVGGLTTTCGYLGIVGGVHVRRLAVLLARGDVPLPVLHQAQRPHVLRVGQQLGLCLGKSCSMDSKFELTTVDFYLSVLTQFNHEGKCICAALKPVESVNLCHDVAGRSWLQL